MAIPQICLLESLWLVLCTPFEVFKWVLLPNLDLHTFGLLVFQLEYSLVLGICSSTIFKLIPFSWWLNLLSKFIGYNNYFCHYKSNLLFIWDNSGYLRYPTHQPGPFWWCEIFGHRCFQLYNIHLYFLWYRIWFYKKWFCPTHTRIIMHSQSVLYKLHFTQTTFLPYVF
jgi:hypothetical protein